MDAGDGFRDLGVLPLTTSSPTTDLSENVDEFPDLSSCQEGQTDYRRLRRAAVIGGEGAGPARASGAPASASEIIGEVQAELREALFGNLGQGGALVSESTRVSTVEPAASSVPLILRARLLQGVNGHLNTTHEDQENVDARDLPSLLRVLGLSGPSLDSVDSSTQADERGKAHSAEYKDTSTGTSAGIEEQELEEHITRLIRDAGSSNHGLCPTHHLPNPASRSEMEAQIQGAEEARQALPNTQGLQEGVQQALAAVLAEIQAGS